MALVAILLAGPGRSAEAQGSWIMLQPAGEVRQGSSLPITIDYCSTTSYFPGMVTLTQFVNGGSGSTIVPGTPTSTGGSCYQMSHTVTLSPGENTLEATLDDGNGVFTDIEVHTWGVWVTPRDSAETATTGGTSTFRFAVQNTTASPRTYGLSAQCTNGYLACSVTSGSSVTVPGGQSVQASVQVTAPSSNGVTGQLRLIATDNSLSTVTDTGSLNITSVQKNLFILNVPPVIATYPNYQKSLTFTVENRGTAAASFTRQHYCPPTWLCSFTGATTVNGSNGTVTNTLLYTPQVGGATLRFAVFETGVSGNRDSVAVDVGVGTPTIDVTAASSLNQPMGTTQNVPITISQIGGAIQVQYSVTCAGNLTCGTPSPSSPLNYSGTGSQVIQVPATAGSISGGSGTIKLVARQVGEDGNADSSTVSIVPIRNLAWSPHDPSENKTANVATSTPLSLSSTGSAAATFNFSVLSCVNLTGCSVTPASASVSAGSPAAVTANYTPGAVGNTGTMKVLAQQSGVALNVDTATITVTPSASGPTIAATPLLTVKNEFASSASHQVSFTFTNNGGSNVTVNFTRTCTGVVSSNCSPAPQQVTIQPGAGNARTEVITFSTGIAGDTGSVVLRATDAGNGTNFAEGRYRIHSVAPKVRVTPDAVYDTIATAGPGKLLSFTVHHDSAYAATYALGPQGDSTVMSACQTAATVSFTGIGSTPVTVSCTAALGTSGYVTLLASQNGTTGNSDVGSRLMTVGAHAVQVTPDDSAVTVSPGSQTQVFRITNTGTLLASYSASTACTTHVTCSPPSQPNALSPGASTNITLPYNSGSSGQSGGKARLVVNVAGTSVVDTGSVIVTTVANYIVADLSINNWDNVLSERCEVSCFAARTAMSTVPYFSLGEPRSITLAYNSDAVAVRPIVHVDVNLTAGAPTLQEWWLEAKDSTGAAITFLNGDTKLRFAAPSPGTTKVRLSGQFDGTAHATGVYPITLIVTAKYVSGTPDVRTLNSRFLVLNERKSPVARGWTIAGLSKLMLHGSDALIVYGSGSATFFTATGSNTFSSPSGDFSRLRAIGPLGNQTWVREYADSSREEYGTTGRLERVISRSLDTTSFTYDGNGRLWRVSDPLRANGSTHLYTQLTYTTQGLQYIDEPGPGTSQSGGRRTSLSVAAADSTLESWTEPGGGSIVTIFKYNASKLLGRIINPRIDTTFFGYNSSTLKVDRVIGPRFLKFPSGAGDTTRLRTNLVPWQTVSVPLTSTASTVAPAVRADTIRAQVRDSLGVTTVFTVDRWGQALVTTTLPGHALQQVSTIVRNATTGLAESVTHHTGAVDQFQYSSATGLPTQVHVAGSTPTSIGYGPFGQVTSVTAAGQPTRQFVLGSRGRVDTAKVVAGSTTYKTAYTYDARHRVRSVTSPGGFVTRYGYDPVFGNLVIDSAPGGRIITRSFDGVGRDSTVVAPQTPRRTTLYDALNRPLQEVLDAGTGAPTTDVTTFVYGDKMNLTSVTDPVGNVYAYVYNALGQVTQFTDPFGGIERTHVDELGRAVAWASRVAQDSVRTTYDALHRPLTVTAKRGATTVRTDSYGYDPAGLWTAGSNAVSRDTAYLDATGWTTAVATRLATDWNKRIVRTYLKDAQSRLDSVHVVYPGAIAATGRKYVWDTNTGALSSARVQGQGPGITLDGNLDVDVVSLPGGATQSVDHVSIGGTMRQGWNSAALTAAFWRAYNYDAAGRIDAQYASNGVNVAQRTMLYDARSRLASLRDSTALTAACDQVASVDYGAELCQPNAVRTFNALDSLRYDAVGNPTYVSNPWTVGAGSLVPQYNRNRVTQWPRAGGTNQYNYHADGSGNARNTGSPKNTFLRWSPDGLLDSVTVGNGGTRERLLVYEYNAFGELVRRSLGAGAGSATVDRHFVWDRGNLLAELDGALAARRSEYAHYPGLDHPFALVTGATAVTATRFVQVDAQGTVLGLTDAAGGVAAEGLETDAWGRLLGGGGAVGDTLRLKWKGLLWEGDSTQLYYVRARWYDPVTRRFVSEDPIGLDGGINPYVYGENDPVGMTDPLGLAACTAAEVMSGWGSLYDEEVGWTCVQLGGGQVLPGVKVSGGWQSGFSRNFGGRSRGGSYGGYGGSDGEAVFGMLGGAAPNVRELLEEAALGAVPLVRSARIARLVRKARLLYPLKPLAERHHKTPIYLGGARNGPTVTIDGAYHQLITNEFRRLWAYGRGRPSSQALSEIMRKVYDKFPLP